MVADNQTPVKSIHDSDVQPLVLAAARNVFETMLSMSVEYVDEPPSRAMPGSRVAGTLGFAGDNISGGIYLQFSETFARLAAATALRINAEDEINSADVNDVVAELCNMVGGTVSSRLSDLGFHCRPTVPFITRGTNFEIELVETTYSRRFVFAHETSRFIIGVFLKTTK